MKKELKLIAISVFATSLALLGNTIDADAAAYIKFDGVDGEATDREHTMWSDMMSFSQTITREDPSGDTTRQRASATLGDVVVTKELDKSSPKLAESILTGKVFPKVEIQLASSAGTYFAYELKNVMITSYSISGGADEMPMESFSLNFEAIKITYTEYDSEGKSKGNVETTWKVEEGTT
jgi:type VI secretion system secreted protein Hcp